MESRKALGVRSGDTVRVSQKIQERGKTRLQVFEGLVLARKHGNEPGGTFTVRRVIDGVGVEKIFPLYSPLIDKIEIVRRAKVRRAKLYYIREKVAREIRRQMRNMRMMNIASKSETEAEAEAKAAEEATAKAEEEEAARKAEEEKAAQEAAKVEEAATTTAAAAEEAKEESAKAEETAPADEEKASE